MTDADLVRLARTGAASGWEQLARRWAARVLAVCRARVCDAATAEELAQESLVRGWQNLHELHEPEKFGPWLRGIAVRVCQDWHRQRARQPQSTADWNGCPGTTPPPAEQLERTETERELLQQLQALPEELQEVVWLFYFDELTYAELADLLGISRATVNARLAKARELLARRLAHQAVI